MKLLKAKEKVEKRLSVFTAPNINGNGSNKNSRAESSNGGSINNNASRTDKEEKDAASPALERQLKAINTSIEKYAIKWQNTQRMSNFKMMNIQGNRIGDEGAKCIGQMLARNKSITSMNLSTNNINEDGFQAIFDALVNNPTLKTLNMSSTNLKGNMYLGHLGSSALKRLMKNNAVVRTLILQNCGVGLLLDAVRDVAHGIVLNKGLVNLDFGSNNLGYNEIAILAQALAQNKHIQVLSLRNNRFGTAGATLLSEVMRVDTGIRRLDLARCGIGLSGFALLTDALARNTNITKLVLDGNHFGSKAQVFLLEGGLGLGGDSNETQQFLQRMLQHYKLTSQWVSPNFSNAPGLTHLNLNSCSINDEFLAALCKVLKTNKVLHTLNINSNHIRDDGAFAVGELLAVNGALKTLDISFNSIQEEGGLAIAAGLKQNNTLTNLNLQDNEVGIDTANRMYECLTFKTHLIRCDVSGNKVPYSIFKKIADLASRYKRQYDINFNDRQYQLIKKLKQQNNALQKNGTPEMMRLQEERVEKELEDLIGSTADWNREQEKVTEDLLRKMKDLQLETIDYLDKYAKIADRKNEPSEEHLKLVSQLEGQISAEKRLKNSKITQMKQLEEELKIKTQELKSEDVLGDRMRNLLKNHTKKAQSERDELKERFTRVEQFIAQLQAELPPEEEKKDEEGDDDANDTSAVNGKNSDRRRGRKMSTGSTSTTTTSSSTSQQSKRRDARTRKSSVKPKGVNPRKSLARLSKTTTTPYQ